MRVRTAGTLVATTTLLVGAATVIFIATPTIAAAMQQHGQEAPPTRTWHAPAVAPSAVTPTPTPTPRASYTGPLVGAAGSVQLTRAELHAWAEGRSFAGQDPKNDAIWEQQQWLDITCMARKGFLEDPTNPALADREVSEEDGLTRAEVTAYRDALWGPPTDAPYDWRTAGCHGRSVHLTGQDDAH